MSRRVGKICRDFPPMSAIGQEQTSSDGFYQDLFRN
jgi:hypothetical protein